MYSVKEWREAFCALLDIADSRNKHLKKCSNCKFIRHIDWQEHNIECENENVMIDLTYTKEDFYCSEYEKDININSIGE